MLRARASADVNGPCSTDINGAPPIYTLLVIWTYTSIDFNAGFMNEAIVGWGPEIFKVKSWPIEVDGKTRIYLSGARFHP